MAEAGRNSRPNPGAHSRYTRSVRTRTIFAALTAACAIAGFASSTETSPIAGAKQLIIVISPGWDSPGATMRRYDRTADGWREAGAPVDVIIGRSVLAWGSGVNRGTGPGPVKREGDGKSPAGVFALGPAFAYEPKELGAMQLPVLHAQETLVCVDDVASGLYNTLVEASAMHAAGRPHGPDTPGAEAQHKLHEPSFERMRRADDQYRFGLVVRHNQDPATPGAGSCIFLHIWRSPESPTSGCTAMAPERLKPLLTRLDPAQKPLLVQLPRDEYARLRQEWGLP